MSFRRGQPRSSKYRPKWLGMLLAGVGVVYIGLLVDTGWKSAQFLTGPDAKAKVPYFNHNDHKKLEEKQKEELIQKHLAAAQDKNKQTPVITETQNNSNSTTR